MQVKLRKIVIENGTNFLRDRKKVEGMINDLFAGEEKKIVNGLKIVIRAGYVDELLDHGIERVGIVIAKYRDEYGVDENLANAVIGLCAYAISGKHITPKLNSPQNYSATPNQNTNTTQKQTATSKPQNKTVKISPAISMEMIFVEGGTFQMSSNYRVTLSDFYIGKYEVTQKEWVEIMGINPSRFIGENLPVESVSWNDVQEFIQNLNKKKRGNYRLPTEAEWEYAARGGKKSNGYEYSGSHNVDEVAWYNGNSRNRTHAVGTKKPNELGIYDMSGNVWEWCQDWSGAYPSTPLTNPKGPSSGNNLVLRGGSWIYYDSYCRVANRDYGSPDGRSDGGGFRLVQNI